MALVAHSTRDEGVYREWESGRRGYKTRWNRPVRLSVPIPPCTRAVVTWPPRPLASSSSIAAITPRALSIYTVSWKTFFLYLSVGETVENTISIAISLFEKSASPLSQRKEKAGYLDHHWGYFFCLGRRYPHVLTFRIELDLILFRFFFSSCKLHPFGNSPPFFKGSFFSDCCLVALESSSVSNPLCGERLGQKKNSHLEFVFFPFLSHFILEIHF